MDLVAFMLFMEWGEVLRLSDLAHMQIPATFPGLSYLGIGEPLRVKMNLNFGISPF